MAAVAEGETDAAGIYWINDTSEDERAVVYAPGMSQKMGLKSVSKISNERKAKGKPALDIKGRTGKTPGRVTDLPVAKTSLQKISGFSSKSKTPPQESETSLTLDVSHRLHVKSKASLKDLCPEDKRRIANLIEELAKVSEEKEESVQRLKDEQETFEKKIQQLEEQNQLIVQERESLQQQYKECQELLGLYQQYLSQQQEKLNQSISQLNHSHFHCKIASSERTLSRAHSGRGRGAALDGSYLDPRNSGRTGSAGCAHSFLAGVCSGPSSMPLCCIEHERGSHEEDTAGVHKCSGGGWSEPAHDIRSKRDQVADDATKPRDSWHELGLKNGTGCCAEPSETVPYIGREDWEEKRQRLLVQKKQLEVERERLQARLAEQEERLLKQNQELRQSRLNHSKFQQELEQSLNEIRFNEAPQTSVTAEPHSERKEGGLQALKGSVRQPLNEIQPQEHNLQQAEPRLSNDLSTVAKKDMATSPVHSQNFQKSSLQRTLPVSHPRTPKSSKLDSSLIELLDIFSPISNTERSRVSSSTHRSLTGPCQPLSAIRPLRTSVLSPRGQTQPSEEELQESQILEDIFFIC
ncbi:protein hinderin isoform X2 [Pangasianodon hypophthalmus]|uniref:protein hinderin isoform X2 n=1 Tax=Pangasianodon hypophthalmus TaxID=310915 RepID=UPI000F000EF4|nr:protein hinderin isoform X2 [Pangasianodon hypophthalmus]